MIWKILVVFLLIWLFFKLFGKRIFFYLLKKLIKKLEAQTLKDMKNFQNMYDKKAKYTYHLNDEFSIIIPESYQSSNKKRKAIIEDVHFEELN